MARKKSDRTQVNVSVPPEEIALIDGLVDAGTYKSRATALMELAKKQLGGNNPVDVFRRLLPEGVEVRKMVDHWECLNNLYWGDQLQPVWLTSNIATYGKSLGCWRPKERLINVIPTVVGDDSATRLSQVLGHEMCHQAQDELYRDLYGSAIGGQGDESHRCVPWSRACFDVILADGLDVFVPVWRRSTGNRWFPWVPAIDEDGEPDWMTMEKVRPDSTFMGMRLLSMKDSMHFCPGMYQPVS